MATTTRNRNRPAREPSARPRNDAYTGLLFISFVALVTSSILLFLDFNQYGGRTAPKLNIPTLGASPIAAVPGPPAPEPVTPPPAGDPMPVPPGGDAVPPGAAGVPPGPMPPGGPVGIPVGPGGPVMPMPGAPPKPPG